MKYLYLEKLRPRILLLVFTWLAVLAAFAQAHVLDLILTDYRILEREVELTLVVPSKALQGLDDDGNGALSADELVRHQATILGALENHIVLMDGNRKGQMQLSRLADGYQAPSLGGLPGSHGAIPLKFSFAEPIQNLAVHYDFFPFPESCVATFRIGNSVQSFTFTKQHTDYLVKEAPGQVSSFFWVGVNHLFTGADHLLFLLALVCCAPAFKSTVKTVTAFTLAHSVSLCLGALGWIQPSPRFVEPMIAGSILYTALYQLRLGERAQNAWKIAFVFGLVHGLSFAGVLNEVQLSGLSWIGALVGFNLGIEFAQLVILGILLPVLWRVRQLDSRGYSLRGLTVLTSILATFWLYERVRTYWF